MATLVYQVSAHFGTKLYEACKHLDTEGEGSITTGQLRKLFFGDYTAPEGSDNKVCASCRRLTFPPMHGTHRGATRRAGERSFQLSGVQYTACRFFLNDLRKHRPSTGTATATTFLKETHALLPRRRALRLVQPYEEVADLEQLQERMVQSLGDYNARSRKPMDLVMFMFAVEHVSRLAR